jgi:hypothetical protein
MIFGSCSFSIWMSQVEYCSIKTSIRYIGFPCEGVICLKRLHNAVLDGFLQTAAIFLRGFIFQCYPLTESGGAGTRIQYKAL